MKKIILKKMQKFALYKYYISSLFRRNKGLEFLTKDGRAQENS